MLTRNDLSAIKKVIKEEVQGSEERQAEKDNGLEKRLSEKITKVQETIDIVQNVVVKHYGELEQRVTSVEEELRNQRN